MNAKTILLTYATRYGSTQEVAGVITAALRRGGLGLECVRHALRGGLRLFLRMSTLFGESCSAWAPSQKLLKEVLACTSWPS